MILGDAYLQKMRGGNARLRLEQSYKQKDYMDWKYKMLSNVFASVPNFLQRVHPKTKRTYKYVRLQSNSSPVLGKMRDQFYNKDGKKIVPKQIEQILESPLTIAVWYMDDGYYDKRDKSAHIYVQAWPPEELDRLACAFGQHNIAPKWYCRPDRRACQLNFTGQNKDNLMELIHPYLIESMRYKTPLDPVTTKNEN